MRQLSLRARLTVWYSLALLAALSVLAVAVVWQQSRIGLRRVDRELDAGTATLRNVFEDELTETSDQRRAAEEAHRTIAMPGRAMAILDGQARELAANWNGLRLADVAEAVQPSGHRAWTIDTPAGSWRVHAVPFAGQGRAFILVVAAPLADVYRERRESQEAMWIVIPIALGLAIVGGWWLATIGLRPITDMAHRASRLAPNGLDDLGQSDRRDELGQLARAFNDLVARLRQALQTQRQFMADASHELRTPLSVVQSAADVTLSREERGGAEYREALTIIATQARRLGRLVDDMLVLARADAGGYPLRKVDLYLDELVAECASTVNVLARERHVAVQAVTPPGTDAGDVPFRGDEDLLRRMLLNIVQNAVHHTRDGSVVRIELSPNGRETSIRVSDQGPGIPDAERTHIFDRFVQLDAARRDAGAGLGLPIARWIAEAHGGTLDLESTGATGSTFRIVLPLAS